LAKPPEASPHSDISGVHRDEKRRPDNAVEAGQDTGDLATARENSTGRPPSTDDQPTPEDRSR
jgi:hypothetical protein